ncbi:MAG TPA: nitroreductase family protein [Dehalococcoidia bacterium]|nr:nitroreductase family protein [Dehalococcoidia bacterium]
MDFDELLELMSRQRAVRSFDTSRPVDDATIEQLLRAATFAPNGGNRQMWRFMVIREPGIKAGLAKLYEEQALIYLGGRPLQGQASWREVPALVAFLSETGGGGATIFPAVQNFLFAAHTLGLGSVLTTLWKGREPEVRALLQVPDDIEMHAILPLGWPDRKYSRSKRRPVSELTYRDRYGTAW